MSNGDVGADDSLADEWFGKNFRAAREARGISQERVADLMRGAGFPHFSQSTVQRAESGGRGKGRSISIGEGFALGRIVGVSADVLIHPPEVARLREELRRAAVNLEGARTTAAGANDAVRFWGAELARLIAEARAGETATGFAGEIARAEQVLERAQP